MQGEARTTALQADSAEAQIIKRLLDGREQMMDALILCEEYLDQLADVVDGEDGRPEPNRELHLLSVVRQALEK